jgi:putative transposase
MNSSKLVRIIVRFCPLPYYFVPKVCVAKQLVVQFDFEMMGCVPVTARARETMLSCEGRNVWFWEMIDEDTKFLVASHVSGTRTLEDTIALFKRGYEQSKVRPRALFVDGSFVYQTAFNKVFYTMRKDTRPELVQRVGIRARETNNLVERMHGTVKDRTRVMRGLKSFESTKSLLEGFTIHYNYVRPHQSLGGKTPAQAARAQAPSNWKGLIDEATRYEAQLLAKATSPEKVEKREVEAIVK